MQKLSETEMKNIEGGASPFIIVSVVTGLITFITGILNGYSNPKKCNN